jgi:hypothetical protein
MEKYFQKELKTAKESGKKALEESSQEDEIKKIRDFAKTHPEMTPGSDVTKLMEQLYAKEQDLEKVYKQACKANDIVPIAITEVDGKEVRTDMTSGKEVDKDGKAVEAKDDKSSVNSLKSDEHKAASDDVDTGELKKDEELEGKSIRDVAAGNWNKVIADAGGTDPWADED